MKMCKREKKKYSIIQNIRQITNKDQLHSTGDYTQYFIKTYKEKESEKNRYACITESLCFAPETDTTL